MGLYFASDEPDDNFIRLNATNGPRCLLTYEIKIERLCARARVSGIYPGKPSLLQYIALPSYFCNIFDAC